MSTVRTGMIDVEDILGQWRAVEAHYSPQTLYQYTLVLRRFLAAAGPPERVTLADVLRFLQPYRLRPAAYNSYLAAIKSLYRAGAMLGWPPHPVSTLRQIPQAGPPAVRVLTVEEVHRLARTPHPACRVAMLLCQTGLRAAEYVGLTDAAIDLERGLLCVIGKGCKRRFVPLNTTARRLLSAPQPPERPSSRHRLTYLMGQAARAGRIERFGPHACRHYFATRLIDAGMPIHQVSRLLGHASISLTVSRYYHRQSFDLDYLESL